jgi:hypothetical protein
MNKMVGFWIVSSAILFLLSLVFLHHQYHRKNALFAWWLCVGVMMQVISAYGMALGYPRWMIRLWVVADWASLGLAAAVVTFAFLHRSCSVNRTLLYGLGAMLFFNILCRTAAGTLNANLQTWLQNIAFFGPAIFLLVSFSNIRIDTLPLHLNPERAVWKFDLTAYQHMAVDSLPDGRWQPAPVKSIAYAQDWAPVNRTPQQPFKAGALR